MRVDLNLKNIKKTKRLGEILEKDIAKLQKHTKADKADSQIHLELKLEKCVHKEDFEGWASLYLPRKTLRVHETCDDKLTLVNNITKNFIRQLEKLKSHVYSSETRKKKSVGKIAADAYIPEGAEFIEIE